MSAPAAPDRLADRGIDRNDRVQEKTNNQDRNFDDEERAFKNEIQVLKELDCYHGYLPREDLGALLKNEGDYILRMSEVDNPQDMSKPNKEIVLSIVAAQIKAPGEQTGTSLMAPPPQLPADLSKEPTLGPAIVAPSNQNQHKSESVFRNKQEKKRNLIVRRLGAKYQVETFRFFTTIKELLDFYHKNQGQVNRVIFNLRNPVKRQYFEYTHGDVKLSEKCLGEGAFGEVRSGTLKKKSGKVVNVAVKLTKGVTTEMGKAKIKEMMHEARLMRNLKHVNVVRLYGIAVVEQPLYIIMELVDGGCLNKYLTDNGHAVDKRERIQLCLMAARGLSYLHSKSVIHRDIAARNCLYTKEKIVKLSDFGLSVIASSYTIKTHAKLPIKWLAPETIATLTFTAKSDIYSYGVLVWEIYMDGAEPWADVSNVDTKKNLSEGRFLQMPPTCPERIRAQVRDGIFVKDPSKRIAMDDMVRVLDFSLLEQSMHETNVTSTRVQKSVMQKTNTGDVGEDDGAGGWKKKSKGFHRRSNQEAQK